MERVPTAFAQQLEQEFDGRYRLRWSAKHSEWHLEQKVGVGAADPPLRVEEGDDSLICARDGYAHVMAIRTGDRMPCPAIVDQFKTRCGFELKVPLRDTREVTCERCQFYGRDGRTAAAYFPLDDSLIQHIRRIDAFLGHRDDIAAEQDAKNKFKMWAIQKDGLNDIDAISYETRKTFGAIEQVGYGRSIIRPSGGDI